MTGQGDDDDDDVRSKASPVDSTVGVDHGTCLLDPTRPDLTSVHNPVRD